MDKRKQKSKDRVINVQVQSLPVHEKHYADSSFVLICEQFKTLDGEDSHIVVRLHFDTSQIEDLSWKLRDQMQHEYKKLSDVSAALREAAEIREKNS